MIDFASLGYLEWMERAACAQSFSGDLHFPESGLAGVPPSKRDIDAALAMCGGCPVRAQCGAYAEELQPEWGIWGGKNYARKWNATKTECDHGHEFTPENTGRDARGNRRCRTCDRENTRKRRAA